MAHRAATGLDDDTHLHVSFDVDFLDPDIAPGVGTSVPGGPSYREAQYGFDRVFVRQEHVDAQGAADVSRASRTSAL